MGSFYAGVAMIIAFVAIILAMVIYALGFWLGLGAIILSFSLTGVLYIGMALLHGDPL